METLIEGKRVIKSLLFADGSTVMELGARTWQAEKIIPYYENGEMAGVIWFAIYRNGVIVSRENSKFVATVTYMDTDEVAQE